MAEARSLKSDALSHGAGLAAAMLALVASSAPSFAVGGPGCPNLPEYDRALGTIENGAYSCGMSMEEAKRILARGAPGAAEPAPARPAQRHRRHHPRLEPPA